MAEVMPYEAEVRIDPRARRLGLRVHPGGRVVVSVPRGVPSTAVLRFMREYQAWVERARARMAPLAPRASKREARAQYLLHKEAARRLVYAKIAVYAKVYGVEVRGVSIRDQKSRWGSCSRHKRLAFNYRLAILPERLAEYVVVHEICHLIEFNHSPRFWALVARTMPDHRTLRRELKNHRL